MIYSIYHTTYPMIHMNQILSFGKTLANLNYLGNKLMSSWAVDRVRIVKLEDFRSNQADYIDSINNFFGINEEPEVKKWFAKVGFRLNTCMPALHG